jgi:hypothetical protein
VTTALQLEKYSDNRSVVSFLHEVEIQLAIPFMKWKYS